MVAWTAWVRANTEGCETVVELGCGNCGKLAYCNATVTRRIGIEISRDWETRRRNYSACTRIWGDARHFEELVEEYPNACALLFDSLEHLTENDALDLLARAKRRFDRILVVVPEGVFPQGPEENNPYQEHHSEWTREDLEALGFAVRVDPTFHPEHPGRGRGEIFARWDKERGNEA